MSLGVTIMDDLEARMVGPDHRRFRVGVALPMSGVLGQVGPSALDAVTLAGYEVKTARGPFDRELELVLVDSGRAPEHVADTVGELAAGGIVDAFVGLHTSDTMFAIERSLGGSAVPYVFTPGHEGVKRSAEVMCTGESPRQLTSGLAAVMRDRGVYEWAVIGTDYVWPRAMSAAARSVIEASNGRVVLDRLVPKGSVRKQIRGLLDDVTRSGAEGVVINMPGSDLITALLAMRARGLDRRILRYSGSLEENALYALGGDRSGNLYAALHSFEGLDSPKRAELLDKYVGAFGAYSPVLNAWAEHCYDATHLVARMEAAGFVVPRSAGMPTSSSPSAGHAGPGRDSSTVNDHSSWREFQDESFEMHLAVASGMAFDDH